MPPKRRLSTHESDAPIKRLKRTTAKMAAAGAAEYDFFKSNFMKIESVKPASFPAADLNNPIHALFQRRNFQSGVDYPAIEMPARLATKLLGAERVQSMLYTIVAHHDPLVELGTEDEHGPHVGYSKGDCQQTFHDRDGKKRRRIDEALQGLATLISFGATESLGEGDGGLTVRTRTPQRKSPAFGAKQQRSRTTYSQAMYDALVAAHHAVQPDMILLTALQFEFGVMLAHEVVHALVVAVEGNLNSEPFSFNHDPDVRDYNVTSEVGYEAERHWFGGGIIDIKFKYKEGRARGRGKKPIPKDVKLHKFEGQACSSLRGVFVLMQYPNHNVIKSYRLWGSYIGVRGIERLAMTDLGWRIKITWIAKFLTEAFWSNVGKDNSLENTLSPKEVGQYFHTEENGDMQTVAPPPVRDLPVGYRKLTSPSNQNIGPLVMKHKSSKGVKKGVMTSGQKSMQQRKKKQA